MKDDLIKILAKSVKILSYELCIRTNGTDKEWEEYALAKALFNYYNVGGSK